MAFKRRYFKVLVFILTISVLFLCTKWMFLASSSVLFKPCNITELNPWDASLRPFLTKPGQLPCNEKYELFYFRSDMQMYMNTSFAETHGLDPLTLECWYRVIRRLDGDMELQMLSRQNLILPTTIPGHLFRVTCIKHNASETVYDMAHFNPFFNEYAKAYDSTEAESASKPSVVMFGIDSVSRSHALRNLPKSYEYLRDKLRCQDLIGYRKVGENTFPNIVPLLTGKSHSSFPHVEHLKMHADNMPFIWNESPVKSMATFFGEDRPDISSFNYVKSGFKKVPTDFYFRPYTLAMSDFEAVFGKTLGKSTADCYGNRNHFQIQMDYLKGFLRKYNGKRKFAFMWSNQVGHESFSSVSRGDEPFLEFLRWMVSETDMSNTIFIVLSDHGFRIGGASLTHVGRAENNNPWIMIHVPDSVSKVYPKLRTHLRENSKRLVTHFDIYTTVYDVIYGRAFQDQEMVPTKKYLVKRNVFHPVPLDRTCIDAGVEDAFCTCKDKVLVETSSPLVQYVAKVLVKYMNEMVSKKLNKCSNMVLVNVTEATVVYSERDDSNLNKELGRSSSWFNKLFHSSPDIDSGTGRYSLFFFTNPGPAFFEGIVDYMAFKAGNQEDKMTVVGDPVRLNRYGNQSHCVDGVKLKPICYCLDML
ncbi:uncharacterized protein LOC128209881 [Mya arenaria]|uniref:uncharacterized protein LOC128209881 n=1 Tax=Mya arenaria TaxID=6604 RepID=UPI0022E4FD99|nr:uncharacterized protein LOC128209881 [Mya arenaria]